MKGLVLGNIDYLLHMSSAGQQLQQGLVEAGWEIAGVGYGDGCADVPTLLERFQPEVVFVQDVRDWLPECNISFRKDIGFSRIECLKHSGIPCYTVLKDAWGWAKEQSKLAADICAAGIASYCHFELVHAVAPWAKQYPLIRIYHSIDAELIRTILRHHGLKAGRKRAIVTGANADCYPLRKLAIQNAAQLGLEVRKHPRYGNRGADTPNYLGELSQYRVHVATAGKWEVAMAKIIESVACGCTPVTNLSRLDVLPEIDGALVRVPTHCTVDELRDAIEQADAQWDQVERMEWAALTREFYDYRAAGVRLSSVLGVAA